MSNSGVREVVVEEEEVKSKITPPSPKFLERCKRHPGAQLIEDRAGDRTCYSCGECGLVVGDRIITDPGSENRTLNNVKEEAGPSRSVNEPKKVQREMVANTANSAINRYEVRCKNHPNAPLIEDYRAGDQICTECGLVVGDRVIDLGSEWRAFNESGRADPSRVGGPENLLLDGGGLSTMIAGGHGEAAFDEFGAPKYQNRRNASSGDRVLMSAFRSISSMCERLNIPNTIADIANNLFKAFIEKRGSSGKGKSNDSSAAAVLYIACRQNDVPRTFKEIVNVAKSSKKDVSQAYKLVSKELDIKMESVSTDDYMERFCNNLKLPKDVQLAAKEIARKVIRFDIAPGRSPISVAAAAIYMASQASSEKRTQKQISAEAGVADVTIRQAYRLMFSKAKMLFPKNFVFATPVDQLPLS